MPPYLPFVLIGLVAAGLLAWSLAHQRRLGRAQTARLDQLGFRPCPDEKTFLEETVTRLENNHGYRYEVHDPKRLPGAKTVYHYIKRRHRFPQDDSEAEEEILFPLKRRSAGGLILMVKPSSLSHGLATRMLAALATGPWDAQPDDLQRLELPPDLVETNVVAAMGAPGASIRELVDDRTLRAVQGLGDAGGMLVQFRDAWCSVASTSAQMPFRVDEVVNRIRPLL